MNGNKQNTFNQVPVKYFSVKMSETRVKTQNWMILCPITGHMSEFKNCTSKYHMEIKLLIDVFFNLATKLRFQYLDKMMTRGDIKNFVVKLKEIQCHLLSSFYQGSGTLTF